MSKQKFKPRTKEYFENYINDEKWMKEHFKYRKDDSFEEDHPLYRKRYMDKNGDDMWGGIYNVSHYSHQVLNQDIHYCLGLILDIKEDEEIDDKTKDENIENVINHHNRLLELSKYLLDYMYETRVTWDEISRKYNYQYYPFDKC